MPLHFRMSRYSSFQRQLNLYDFQRITEGPDKGAYHVRPERQLFNSITWSSWKFLHFCIVFYIFSTACLLKVNQTYYAV
jgi:HSF-type DNA-binding